MSTKEKIILHETIRMMGRSMNHTLSVCIEEAVSFQGPIRHSQWRTKFNLVDICGASLKASGICISSIGECNEFPWMVYVISANLYTHISIEVILALNFFFGINNIWIYKSICFHFYFIFL